MHRGDLAFDAAQTETARHQDRVHAFEQTGALVLDVFGVDVTEIHFGTALDAGVAHGLDQRFVGIEKFHVLADHGDGDFLLGIQLGIDHAVPLGEIGATAFEAETLEHIVVQPLGMQHARNLVDGVGVRQADHRSLFDVGEQGDLAPRGQVDRYFRTAHQHVRLQADGA